MENDPGPLHRHERAFDEHNRFLPLVLGMVSAARRAERLAGDAAVLPHSKSEDEPGSAIGNERFLHFALGLISLARNVLANAGAAALETAAARSTQCPSPSDSSQSTRLRDLFL